MGSKVYFDDLIKDRFEEFRLLAEEKGLLAQDPVDATGSSFVATIIGQRIHDKFLGQDPNQNEDTGGRRQVMKEFFDEVKQIQEAIGQGSQCVKTVEKLKEEVLTATTSAREAELQDRIQEQMDLTSRRIGQAKKGLDSLREQSDRNTSRSSAEAKIQHNIQQATTKMLEKLLLEFQTSQLEYKKDLQQRQAKQMRAIMPEITDEHARDLIEQGTTAQVMMTQKMGGAHALLLDELDRVREKQQAVLKLERSIAELCQMFQDMAVLVEAQGEMLDAIELNVHKTNVATSKAETELKTTQKHQRKNRKMMLCLMVVVIVLLVIILAPILQSVL